MLRVILLLFSLILLSVSCIPLHNVFVKARKSFLFLKKKEFYGACTSDKCIHLKTIKTSGSSAIVHHTEKHSYLLTASHMCRYAYDMDIMFRFYIHSIKGNTPGKILKSQSITLVDLEGKAYPAKVIKNDKLADLCLVRTKRIHRKALVLANHPPAIGEMVYNVAAPSGIFAKNMVPLFHGIFSGTTLNPFSSKVKSDIYSIPLTGGSSGSPILNYKGELVGMIHSRLVRFENLAYSATHEQIVLFLHRTLMKQNFHKVHRIMTFSD